MSVRSSYLTCLLPAVTRSATCAVAEAKQVKVAAEKTRFALPDFLLNLSYEDLVKEQGADPSVFFV